MGRGIGKTRSEKEREGGYDETKRERVREIRIDNLEKNIGKVACPFIKGSTFLYPAILSAVVFAVGLTKGVIYPIALLVFFLSVSVVIVGFLTVKEKEKPVVERFGQYWKILKPGPNIIIPLVDRIAYDFDTRATKLPLFMDVEGIEFKDSTEKKVDFGVYVGITDAYRAAYFAKDDVYDFTKDIVENIAKRVFGETFVDDAIENKIKVRDSTNQYLSKPMEELAESLDDEYLKLLGISRDQAEKISPNKILRIAGVAVTDPYFNDIGLGEITKEKRAELLKIRLDEKIAQRTEKVEKAKIGVEEQVAEQVKTKESGVGTGRRRRWDIMRGDGDLTDREVLEWERDMAKYGEGVDSISEINIQGGSGTAESTAAAGAILGKTFAEASEDRKRTPKPKEPEE